MTGHYVRGPLLTVGHGTASMERLAELLVGAGVRRIIDVRRYPGSRAHPHVGRGALQQWMPDNGLDYRWDERLGGRRRLPPDGSPDGWWKVDAFRAYAAHMRSPDFLKAMADLLDEAASSTTAVMCSEAVWWRCHRRLIADFATTARRVQVCHLFHDGRLMEHPAAAGAQLAEDGLLVYDRL